jgi:hypothetical protein
VDALLSSADLEPPTYLWPGDDVLSTTHAGNTVLVSLDRDAYLVLDAVGSVAWTVVEANGTFHDACDEVSRVFEVSDIHRVRDDLSHIFRDLEHRGFLRRSREPQAVTSRLRPVQAEDEPASDLASIDRHAPGVLVCALTLTVAKLLLRRSGLRRVLRFAYGRPGRRCPPSDSALWLKRTARNIAVAAALNPLVPQCLERSVCFVFLAHRAGVPVTLRLGVLPFPLDAHAWIEYRGAAVGENREFLNLFRPFPPLTRDCL